MGIMFKVKKISFDTHKYRTFFGMLLGVYREINNCNIKKMIVER